jgi:hypothetical protein
MENCFVGRDAIHQQIGCHTLVALAGRVMKHAPDAGGHGQLTRDEISIGEGKVFALARVPRRSAIE